MSAPPLNAGDWLSRREFLLRWKAHPQIKKAELIGGIVYLWQEANPEHAAMHSAMIGLLGYYASSTPGLHSGCNTTVLMLGDAPQPDVHLRILPEYGGRSAAEDDLLSGTPEAIAEICLSAAAYDLHQKLDLYEKAGVQEYIAILLHEREIRWQRLTDDGFEVMQPGADGVYRSTAFPGLWLDAKSLLAHDMDRVVGTLQQGLKTRDHAEFVAKLGRERR